ncbi:UNVERIFIED_CONTAM: hypothetical protein K2H54_050012 [Gekko kuhli]
MFQPLAIHFICLNCTTWTANPIFGPGVDFKPFNNVLMRTNTGGGGMPQVKDCHFCYCFCTIAGEYKISSCRKLKCNSHIYSPTGQMQAMWSPLAVLHSILNNTTSRAFAFHSKGSRLFMHTSVFVLKMF